MGHKIQVFGNGDEIQLRNLGSGMKNVNISDNLRYIILSSESRNHGVRLGKAMHTVEASAFALDTNLTSVSSSKNISSIAEYAFYGCDKLTDVDIYSEKNEGLMFIGDYAFAKTGIQSLKLNLKGSVSDSAYGEFIFASCMNLQDVQLVRSSFIGPYMFDNCKNLRSVTINNVHSYIYEGGFRGCTGLTKFTLPSNTYMIPDNFFEGCTNLNQLTLVDESASKSQIKYIGNNVFKGCTNIKELVIPTSITSFDMIMPQFLEGNSSIERITFKGIPHDKFVDVSQETIQIDFDSHKLYQEDLDKVYNFAIEKHIPMVLILSKGPNQGCGHCNQMHKDFHEKSFETWLQNECKVFLLYGCPYGTAAYKFVEKHIPSGHTYVEVYYYWKKEDGSTYSKFVDAFGGDFKTMKYNIEHNFVGWTGLTQVETREYVKDQIKKYSSGRDYVTFVSNDGYEYQISSDFEISYERGYKVDNNTTDNFKYGIWYGNAKKVFQYANEHNIPVFAEYSSAGCGPCMMFAANVFNSQTFQDYVKNAPCLFCRIEIHGGESFSIQGSQAYFISHEWSKNPNMFIPVLMYYWKMSDGRYKVINPSNLGSPSYSATKDLFQYNFNNYDSSLVQYANEETVKKYLDALIAGYTRNTAYNAPTITTLEEKHSYKYSNLTYDTTGQFFVADVRNQVTETSKSFTIQLNSSTNVTVTKLTKGQAPTSNMSGQFPAGTYMVFTEQGMIWDKSGYIFRINSSGTVDYIFEIQNFNETQQTTTTQRNYSYSNYYVINDNSPDSVFQEIYDLVLGDYRVVLFTTLDGKTGTDSYANFQSKVSSSQAFKDFVRDNKYIFIELKCTGATWKTTGICKKATDLLSAYRKTTVTIGGQKMFLMQACLACSVDPNNLDKYVDKVFDISGLSNTQQVINTISTQTWSWLEL